MRETAIERLWWNKAYSLIPSTNTIECQLEARPGRRSGRELGAGTSAIYQPVQKYSFQYFLSLNCCTGAYTSLESSQVSDAGAWKWGQCTGTNPSLHHCRKFSPASSLAYTTTSPLSNNYSTFYQRQLSIPILWLYVNENMYNMYCALFNVWFVLRCIYVRISSSLSIIKKYWILPHMFI